MIRRATGCSHAAVRGLKDHRDVLGGSRLHSAFRPGELIVDRQDATQDGCAPSCYTEQLMRHKHSDYMHWSKTQSRARFNLATSGVAPFPLRELPVHLETLEINADISYGYAPLQKAVATHYGVDPDCVVESAGTSMANHLAMAAILEPGDEVLSEHPTYGPILDVARYLNSDAKRFPRSEEL